LRCLERGVLLWKEVVATVVIVVFAAVVLVVNVVVVVRRFVYVFLIMHNGILDKLK